MTKFLAVVTLITQLMPQLIALIRAVEAIFPESGQGQNKLSVVRSALEAAYSGFADAKISFAEAWPSVEKVIASLVALYNTTGVFKK